MSEGKIKLGETEVETLWLNGWGLGDILEGDEGHGPDRILITAIGAKKFTARWDYKCTGDWADETGNTTLVCRNWKKVGNLFEMNYLEGLNECNK